jgi:ferrochelatase
MSKTKKALLIVNLGTPDSPDISHVRKFLSEFLNDRRVIDLPWLLQKLLVNLVIVPFRSSKSSELYKRLWTINGSPILFYLNNLVAKLEIKLNRDFEVFGVMRYGNPSLKGALKNIKEGCFDEITIFPMFPQFASSTTGSIADLILSEISKWQHIPSLKFIDQYYSHPAFVEAFSNRILSFKPALFSHVVFSYHGLPVTHINKAHPGIDCNDCTCTMAMTEYGRHCYKAACYETTRLLAHKSGLASGTFTTTFQSRMSKNWLAPFTDDTLVHLASMGHKKILIVAPSFVADCLETSIELGEDYVALFRQNQGQELVLVESLNDRDDWIDAIAHIIQV